jgi:Kef-type K+ transport system membrane component KefB
MEAVSLDNLAIVAAVAFAAPLLLGFAPGLRAPSVLVEILAGVVLGPSVLDWVQADTAVEVLALIGVGFLLLLAGIEIDFDQLRGRLLSVALAGFVVSFAIALAVSYGLSAAGVVSSPFLIAVILSATSLAVVLPLLKDSGLIESRFGQVVIAGASIADVATVLLLSLFFSGESTSLESRLVLFGVFGLLCVVVAALVAAGGHLSRLSGVLFRLQDTTAQIRVRGTFLLLLVFSIVAQRFGLEAILGTFLAGAILKLADRDDMMSHSHFHAKLEEAGFGFFIPVFFVSSGIKFDAQALFADGSTLAKVPIFLLALYLIRGLPALLYRPLIGGRLTIAAGVLQATTLSFVLIASQIGEQLGLITAAISAALTAAALLSVLINPVVALTLLRSPPQPAEKSPPTGGNAAGTPQPEDTLGAGLATGP